LNELGSWLGVAPEVLALNALRERFLDYLIETSFMN
jgi:hypothetical protein